MDLNQTVVDSDGCVDLNHKLVVDSLVVMAVWT